jgi:D-3-phosphoglycerate dehydrogenase
MKIILSGDPMIKGELFEAAYQKHLKVFANNVVVKDWETDWTKLQDRRLKVEQNGPEIEVVPEVVLESGKDAQILAGLFFPASSKVMEAMPNLRLIGMARAGKENVNLKEATKRGILVFNVMGRNAEAVSDFAVGLILAESRNIARAHFSIKNGGWKKEFSNNDFVPQLKGKKVGIAGFGYIGQLVAKKLSGWDLEVLVYDAYAKPEDIKAAGCTPVDKETLFKESDFISVHLRLVDATKNWVDKKHLELMKKTSYLINTSRSGLIEMDALYGALKAKKIAGAGIDVFDNEPLEENSKWLTLENITMTTHIAGTTTEVLTKSPYLLFEDIEGFLKGAKPKGLINPEALDHPEVIKWLAQVRK